MKKLIVLNKILKRTKAYQIIASLVIVVFLLAFVIFLREPDITTYGDALWYVFADMFTVGFGDIVATTPLARILSVFLTVYTSFVLALVTGVVVSFYTEIVSLKYKESREHILSSLTKLPELSKEELTELAEKIKKIDK